MPEINRSNETVEICLRCGNAKGNCHCPDLDDYTEAVQLKARDQGKYGMPDRFAPYGYFSGRPIIGRDSSINLGVYTTGNSEALVVDDRKYKLTRQCWEDFRTYLDSRILRGENHKEGIFKAVLDFVLSKLHYNLEEVNEINSAIADETGQHDSFKVSLDVFLEAGVGVCRHQAILAAYLFEKMTQERYMEPNSPVSRHYLNGKASVDRCLARDLHSAHAWARYVTKAGEIVIIDPAQNFIGTFSDLEEKRKEKTATGRGLWYYEDVEHIRD